MLRTWPTPPRQSPLIELRLWRQFLAVADALHFGRAAQQLHMTQPPVTQAIAQLEVLLGVTLFDRTKRSVKLTVTGAALVPPARDLLARAGIVPVGPSSTHWRCLSAWRWPRCWLSRW